MAASLSDIQNEEFENSCLFLNDEDGSPILFYITPGPLKKRLKTLIEVRGGIVSSKITPGVDTILLQESSKDKPLLDGYTSSEYIKDCIHKNELLNIKPYQARATEKAGKSKLGAVSSSNSANIVKSTTGGRAKYTYEEDQAILDYVKQYACPGIPVGGNVLWKQMEREKVTGHSWQSMQCRYRKILRPVVSRVKKPKRLDLFVTKAKKPALSSSTRPKRLSARVCATQVKSYLVSSENSSDVDSGSEPQVKKVVGKRTNTIANSTDDEKMIRQTPRKNRPRFFDTTEHSKSDSDCYSSGNDSYNDGGHTNHTTSAQKRKIMQQTKYRKGLGDASPNKKKQASVDRDDDADQGAAPDAAAVDDEDDSLEDDGDEGGANVDHNEVINLKDETEFADTINMIFDKLQQIEDLRRKHNVSRVEVVNALRKASGSVSEASHALQSCKGASDPEEVLQSSEEKAGKTNEASHPLKRMIKTNEALQSPIKSKKDEVRSKVSTIEATQAPCGGGQSNKALRSREKAGKDKEATQSAKISESSNNAIKSPWKGRNDNEDIHSPCKGKIVSEDVKSPRKGRNVIKAFQSPKKGSKSSEESDNHKATNSPKKKSKTNVAILSPKKSGSTSHALRPSKRVRESYEAPQLRKRRHGNKTVLG
ncbi:predicted protein [Nematostella vectensis]|uniref:Telomeric repeat-binding factor 2-interacting protein 1 n=1 Tax=Nematostella vectensis TaxID=45351 RepID=A7RVV1_NEMVE|nr:predicted protein [Nematostella vectensis]|eukprot:XP_001636514.1 predicted protein [Nematostella vectensis]